MGSGSGYDAVVVGAGYAGSTMARELAERGGQKVLILESRPWIGGNAYDCYDDAGVLIHLYGPHIFHSKEKRVFDYLSRFTDWLDYQHEVLANVYGTYIPVPFNKNSMRIVYGEERAAELIDKLIATFGDERKVPINDLRAESDPDLVEIADYVYNNVFLYYTQKQWGVTPEEVDPSVTARVPVFISDDNRYFQDPYQGIPAEGYTKMFERMLDHPNITVRTSTDARDVLEFTQDADGKKVIRMDGEPFTGTVIYTGPLDELFGLCYGRLPYRSLDFDFETLPQEHFQPRGTINYTVSEDFTRISEFKYFSGQDIPDATTIVREYPRAYTGEDGQIPYYAILNDENRAHHARYLELASAYPNLHPLGRLAEYRYYNMDVICKRALELADELLGCATR
jgi:UDP-galactopyranose mutase